MDITFRKIKLHAQSLSSHLEIELFQSITFSF
jgi:hypothetical protein